MEEAKAAAYYDELSRKGEGAARFKQGLGFSSKSSSNDVVPSRGSALSSSSFLSKFVKASSPSTASDSHRKSQLESIQNKLRKAPKIDDSHDQSRVKEWDRDRPSRRRSHSPSGDRDRHSRRRSRSRSRDRARHSRRRSRSRDSYRSRHKYRDGSPSSSRDGTKNRRRDKERKRWRRSRSPTISDEDSGRRSRSRSASPRDRRSEKSRSDGDKAARERRRGTDYSKLIEGYDKMTPAERVKNKMKLQLSETAEKDETKGSGWERFEFSKDAPLDDEEFEAAEDDAALVKNLGQSFRLSAREARRENEIKAAHDEAIFGAPAPAPPRSPDDEEMDDGKNVDTETGIVRSLISEQVITRQQGSWRDRARKV